jgi:exodeoxyribonuclease VII small subunit
MAKRTQTPPRSFEEAQAELEQIVADIENGQIPLEESLLKYERGTFLVQYCQGVLKKAEEQIELLSKGPNGELQSTPLPSESQQNGTNPAP